MEKYRILAENYFVNNDDYKSGLNNNDLIIGSSGTGKTTGYVIPNVRRCNENMIILDTKGQLYKQTRGDLIKQGYEVKCIDFVNPSRSDSYNPFDYIAKRDGRYSDKDISAMANILCPDSRLDLDPFWTRSARQVLSFMIAYTLETAEYPSMFAMTDLFGKFDAKGIRDLDFWALNHRNTYAGKQFFMFRPCVASVRTWGCLLQTVATSLDLFMSLDLAGIFAPRTKRKTDFKKFYQSPKKKLAYFVNCSDTDHAYDRLVQLYITQALQVICRGADECPNGRLARPIRFYLDDFAANTRIDDFDKIISVIRSRNISVSVILQNLTQLESMYGHASANTIITNCDHILYLGGQDIETARYISVRCEKQYETIMYMPSDKVYAIERGKKGQQYNRNNPFKNLDKDNEIRNRLLMEHLSQA